MVCFPSGNYYGDTGMESGHRRQLVSAYALMATLLCTEAARSQHAGLCAKAAGRAWVSWIAEGRSDLHCQNGQQTTI